MPANAQPFSANSVFKISSVNGGVFLKGFLIKERIFKSLHTCLTEKKGIYFVLKTNDEAVTLGTALAAFLN